MQIIKGDLIKLALQGYFNVIVHGCNCFNTMGSGIAKEMKRVFKTDTFPFEEDDYKGNKNKLGCIDFKIVHITKSGKVHSIVSKNSYVGSGEIEDPIVYNIYVVNAYTQYNYGGDGKLYLNYDALRECLKSINIEFQNKIIGMPKIGCGLAGGDWEIVKKIIKEELTNVREIIIVEYDK